VTEHLSSTHVQRIVIDFPIGEAATDAAHYTTVKARAMLRNESAIDDLMTALEGRGTLSDHGVVALNEPAVPMPSKPATGRRGRLPGTKNKPKVAAPTNGEDTSEASPQA
jgi:hypothetical protein